MPKFVEPAERRAAFSAAAVEAIDHHGLEALRLRDVARAAGATTGAITHYFDGKDELLEATLSAIMDALVERVAAGAAEDPVTLAASCLPVDPESARDWRVWLAFCGRAATSTRLRAAHCHHYARLVAVLRERGIGAAEADALIAAVDGIGLRATLDPGPFPPARQYALLEALLRPLFPFPEASPC